MSTLRDNCGAEKLLAHSILDRVRAGDDVPAANVVWALTKLGETL